MDPSWCFDPVVRSTRTNQEQKMFNFLWGKRKSSARQALENPYFPPSVPLDHLPLTRNGQGVRKRFGLQMYDMALYLPTATTTTEQALAMPGPKQVRFVAKRSLSGGVLGVAMLNGLRKNLLPGQETRFAPHTHKIIQVFKSQPDVGKDHTFRIDLLPDHGACFYIDDDLKAAPIHAPGFNEAVLRIWLGQYPVDAELKRHLLAGSG